MKAKEKLIEALSKKQKELNLTQEQFADLLGVNRSTWLQVIRGQNNLGLRMLAGITKTFPELEPLMLDYLKNYSPEPDINLIAS